MKKVDVKMKNRKYCISFREEKQKKTNEPIVLGMNGKNEIRIMVTQDSMDDGEELVQHIKDAFTKYMQDMSEKTFEEQTFYDVLLQSKKDPFHEEMITVIVGEKSMILQKDNETICLQYSNIEQLYAQHKMDMSQSHHKEDRMVYQFQYDIAIVLECDNEEYIFTSTGVESLFFALSQAYFMAQLKGARRNDF